MRVRPSTLTLLCLFFIDALDWVIPEMRVQFPGQFLIASAIGTAGLVLLLLAIRGFYRAKTTVLSDAMDQSTALVTDGLYQISRNPMYLGMAAIILGAGLALGTWITLPVLTAFV
jgi:protein-S-isoprenylcysteine O-methyltransferase Ste14